MRLAVLTVLVAALVAAIAGAALAAGDPAAAGAPTATVTSPGHGEHLRAAPTVAVRVDGDGSVDAVQVRVARGGEALAGPVHATAAAPAADGSRRFRTQLSAVPLGAVANGPARVEARVVNADGNAGPWAGTDVVLDLDPMPTTITAHAVEAGGVTLRWEQVPLAPEGRYEIQRASGGGTFATVATAEFSAETGYRDEPGPGHYRYRIATSRRGADPGVVRAAHSAPVEIRIPDESAPPTSAPAGEPQPDPARGAESPPAPPSGADPEPQAQPSPQPQPGSAGRPGPDPAGGPGQGGEPDARGEPDAAQDPPPARGPDTAAQSSRVEPTPGRPSPSGGSASSPRLRSQSRPRLDERQLAGDVQPPAVAPPEVADAEADVADEDPDQPGSAPRSGRDLAAVRPPTAAAGTDPATLDVLHRRAASPPVGTALAALVVFGVAVLALRRGPAGG